MLQSAARGKMIQMHTAGEVRSVGNEKESLTQHEPISRLSRRRETEDEGQQLEQVLGKRLGKTQQRELGRNIEKTPHGTRRWWQTKSGVPGLTGPCKADLWSETARH